MKRIISILISYSIILQPLSVYAKRTVIDLDGEYSIIHTQNVVNPIRNSRVTYVMDGVEYRPDGYVYDQEDQTGQQWGIIASDRDLLLHSQKLENYANENNIDLFVNLQSSKITDSNGNSVHADGLTYSNNSENPLTRGGFFTTPKLGSSFSSDGHHYADDGKVYLDGGWTGEYWGIPTGKPQDFGGSSLWDGIGSAFGDKKMEQGFNAIIKYKKSITRDKLWEQYAEEKRDFYKKQILNLQREDYKHSKDINDQTSKIKNNTTNFINSIADLPRQFENNNSIHGKVDFYKSTNSFADFKSDQIFYKFKEGTQKKLITNFIHAIEIHDFDRVVSIADIFLNSKVGLPEKFKKYFNGSIIQPHLIDQTIEPSPLTGFKQNWEQSSHAGQLATRAANALQKNWAIQKGYGFSPTHELLRYLTSLSYFIDATGSIDLDPNIAKSMFLLSRFLIDTPAGMAVGAYKALEDIVQSIPIIANALGEFTVNSFKDPNHVISTYHKILSSLPSIKMAILQGINESIESLFGASHYQRGKVLGDIFFDTIMNFCTLNPSVAARKAVNSGSKIVQNLKSLGLPIKKSPQWLEANKKMVESYIDFASKVEDIQFYSPAYPGDLHVRPLNPKQKVNELIIDERGVIRNDSIIGNQTLAHTFRGEQYMSYITKESMYFIQVTSKKNSNKIGKFWSTVVAKGPGQTQLDLALLPEWGNKVDHWRIVEVPKGTKVFEGQVAAQKFSDEFGPGGSELANKLGKIFGPRNVLWTGGAPQIIIDVKKVPKGWIKYYGDF